MDQIDFFKCLADETRFKIVMLVVKNNEQCVCDLTEKLQLSQPKISRHLALLRALGLLRDRRQGQWVYYSLNPNLPTCYLDILNILKNADLQPKVAALLQQINRDCE
ncbi:MULTISPECIES: metalloregulator ArsR/SmtB family transcription factor [unclassified Acinetobacter]|uniref:metalloregulator ArsR/SmtB family transcription factor n=1 Tax=unclassified Acinetobacter TaxID=196816 RepID=UPI00293418E7|nr:MULTISPECIES: metalloregulator ArsR/SmtB family transcription factor [unclassified Acinetobacter]WOE31501.1 metalloregulator ArsR/SmtB family transcription factor [Acinetobacter sp. SAAs470]WOE39697.1 metalloregulator ArsR/SmtB family transcription factor [Acinetobacter sp. SAAs474]